MRVVLSACGLAVVMAGALMFAQERQLPSFKTGVQLSASTWRS
jgi:hypothetical protein